MFAFYSSLNITAFTVHVFLRLFWQVLLLLLLLNNSGEENKKKFSFFSLSLLPDTALAMRQLLMLSPNMLGWLPCACVLLPCTLALYLEVRLLCLGSQHYCACECVRERRIRERMVICYLWMRSSQRVRSDPELIVCPSLI